MKRYCEGLEEESLTTEHQTSRRGPVLLVLHLLKDERRAGNDFEAAVLAIHQVLYIFRK